MSASDGQAALASVLDFLFAAHLEAADAFAAAKSLMEAGVNSREAIAALTPDRVKQLTDKKCHRKLLAAMRKTELPTLDSPDRASAESPSKKQRQENPPPPPPPPPMPPALPDVVLNRSPVMILWAAAIAHVLGHSWAESLSLGSACAAIFARAKGQSLGLHAPSSGATSSSSTDDVRLLGRRVPCARAPDGSLRGMSEKKHAAGCFEPVSPSAVFRSLSGAFNTSLGAAWHSFLALAQAIPMASLTAHDNDLVRAPTHTTRHVTAPPSPPSHDHAPNGPLCVPCAAPTLVPAGLPTLCAVPTAGAEWPRRLGSTRQAATCHGR